MNTFLTLALIAALTVAGASAQCTTFPDNVDSNVCKFGDQERTTNSGAAGICGDVNQNPFYAMTEQCYELMKQDGKPCRYAVGSYYCSSLCADCDLSFVPPCEDVCASVEQDCPTMWATPACRTTNCVADARCTQTEVNKSKVDDIVGGGDSGSAPGKPSVSLAVIVVGFAALYTFTVLFSPNH